MEVVVGVVGFLEQATHLSHYVRVSMSNKPL